MAHQFIVTLFPNRDIRASANSKNNTVSCFSSEYWDHDDNEVVKGKVRLSKLPPLLCSSWNSNRIDERIVTGTDVLDYLMY